jgi:putative ABC transport system substrate-binding protein
LPLGEGMTTRRQFIQASALAALAPIRVLAQQRKPVKIGVLLPRPPAQSNYAPAFTKRLEELGYREDGMLKAIYRPVDGRVERYPAMARELVTEKCDLFLAFGMAPARALRDLRSATPSVFLAVEGDPVRGGVISSLRRPDGNITGVYIPAEAMVAKRVEMAREMLPLKRLLVLSDAGSKHLVEPARAVAEARGIRFSVTQFTQVPYDYAAAFQNAFTNKADAVVMTGGPRFSSDIHAISALLLKHRLPGIGFAVQHADAGILLTLSANQEKAARRLAEVVVQVLNGANPADIPVEQTDEFELVVNLRTARALGVKIPQSVLVRATRLIE